ncbi:uncharacterized protein MKK02DRAFT_37753 [Dioszegia hungarica]|uniref:Uncharacterized protein n=1 Tax=Dioszegia hungarica TaxID=4972 RepID=A0AA38H6M8_9TREE|nr:uncharacterized protein MKK02DRAFT_37753 [Dioszegia hungarica]KAI9634878.1 hypothetical protein MKK02DRAFT_37753 [Dioszegia hungarica]
MSLQDRLGTQDATQLLTLASGLALATAAGGTSWSYNLPLMLFGVIAHEMPSTHQPLRHFISLTTFSAIFDLLTLFSAGFGFTFLFALVLLVLKAPIVVTSIAVLKERGGSLGALEGLGGCRPEVQVAGRAVNWVPSMPAMPTMPGGFSGSPNAQQPSNSNAPPASFPSSGGFRLGGEEDGQGAPPPVPAPGRNGYSSIA